MENKYQFIKTITKTFFYNEEKMQKSYKNEFEALKFEMQNTKEELDATIINFNNATDPDMVEFFIYKIKSLQINYQNLLKHMRKMNEKIS